MSKKDVQLWAFAVGCTILVPAIGFAFGFVLSWIFGRL